MRGQMAARGLVNSSIAEGEVMKAIMSVAMPIAENEVKTLVDNLYYNTDWTNKDRMMANDYAYQEMMTKLQGAINYKLQLLKNHGLYSIASIGRYVRLNG